MICIYESDCTDFSNNGLGLLNPQACSVNETLNGEYEVQMTHPIDDAGKWKRICTDRILRVPVPAAITPQINMTVRASGDASQTIETHVYKVSTRRDPLRLRSGTGTRYSILGRYAKGTEVIVLDTTNAAWYEVSCPDGKRGYMYAGYLTYVRTDTQTVDTESGVNDETITVIESRQMRDQLFRIYRVAPELDKITVYARHIFYDLLDNMIQSYAPASTDAGASVLQGLSGACLSDHAFTFYSDLTSTAEDVTFENINPVEAILGTDGLIDKYGGELARDLFDVYVVRRAGSDANVIIREGKNLLGITYDADQTNVATRILPTGEDGDGNTLYLPEKYIDSPHINDYPHPKWQHLPVSEAKVSDSDDEPRSADDCYKIMRDAVQAQLDAGCDIPDITLKVDFIHLKDTEEYRQYRALENIYLGDSVTVIVKRLGIAVKMRMTQYSYDCLTGRYSSMVLGSAEEALSGNVVSGRQLPSGVITASKLAGNSVGSRQLRAEAVHADHIEAGAISTEKLAAGAVTAQKLAAGSVTTEKLAAGAVDAQAIAAVTAKVGTLTADSIKSDQLAAALAAFQVVAAGSATFDAATIRHLISAALNVENTVSGEAFIKNLRVMYAQIVAATIGDLCIKASDGNYYRIDVITDDDGTVKVEATLTTVTEDEISQGHTDAGRAILATDITAENLSAANIYATYALVNRIDAARIDVGTLLARQAFIDQLNTMDIRSNNFLQIMVGDATVWRVEIDSSNADVLTDGSSTTLSARVYQGAIERTDEIAAARFRWRRDGDDPDADAAWNAAHRGVKSVTVSGGDVRYNAVYSCDVLDAVDLLTSDGDTLLDANDNVLSVLEVT